MQVRIALLGAGAMGNRHIKAIENVVEAKLVAIVDPSPIAKKISSDKQIPYYEFFKDMLDTELLDAVIIATPTERHHKDLMMVLDHGFHVLIEKPITSTFEQAKEAILLADNKGCKVLVGHQRRYYPCAKVARDIVRFGSIGSLVSVIGQWNTRKDDAYYKSKWRKEPEAGPILTNLVHEIDLLRFICGEIEAVSAVVAHHDQCFAKEDAVAIIIQFTNNALGSFVMSDRTPSPWTWEMALGENVKFPKTNQNVIRFMGTNGSLEFPNLMLWKYADSVGSWHSEIKCQPIKTPFIDAYVAQCKHFCSVVQGKEAPAVDGFSGAQSLKATLAVVESSKSGNRITGIF